jgi:poly-gamma-glutamate synthesis protein (capsule biosynthesis protein)
MVHHLGGAPEIISLEKLLSGRRQRTFDLYLGPSRQPTSWIAIGGDVMPDDGAPPEAIGRRLRAADVAVANLETTVGTAARPVQKRYTFQIPSGRLGDLRALHLSAVSLGNNHAGDFGEQGLAGTLAALDAGGVGHFGAGQDLHAAVSPWYVTVKGVTVAFVAVSLVDPDLLPAGERRPGIAVLPRHERELAAAIAEAGRRASCVIVLVHWGAEGTPTVTDEQRRWARWLVEQGASAVIGSGPHEVQADETIAGAPVYYSLGNLWFRGRWPKASRTAGIAFLGLDGVGRVVANRLERIAPSTIRESADDVSSAKRSRASREHFHAH